MTLTWYRHFLPYFPYHFTIQTTFLPHFPCLFTIQLTFLPYFSNHFTIQLGFLPYFLVSNTYCVVFLFCFSSSCVPYVAIFSEFSFFFIVPSVFSNVYQTLSSFKLTKHIFIDFSMTDRSARKKKKHFIQIISILLNAYFIDFNVFILIILCPSVEQVSKISSIKSRWNTTCKLQIHKTHLRQSLLTVIPSPSQG